MSLLMLPPEILYCILGEVTAGYIETAITTPPSNDWDTLDSEFQSEWYTDDEDSDADFDSGVYDSSEDDSQPDSDRAEVPEMDHGQHDNYSSASGLASPPLASLDDIADDDVESEEDVVSQGATPLDGENDVQGLWNLEQEGRFDPDNVLAFKQHLWDVIEARESLPRNDIAPLLSVCHYVRETTFKVLEDALGLERVPDGSTNQNPWYLLRLLRRHYRITHTQPFELPPAEYPVRITPLVQCYYWLSGLAYSLRHMHNLIYMKPSESQEAILGMLNLITIADIIPQQTFRPRIKQRAYIYLVHMRRYISVSMYCADITCTYKDMFSLKGTSRNPGFIVHNDKIPAFQKAVQAFVQFDRKHMDRKNYPELPGHLVELSGVVRVLRNIKKLKYVAEFRKNERIMASTDDAIQLLENWKRRAEYSSYIYTERQS